MNLGVSVVAGNITLNGVAATYTITIGGDPDQRGGLVGEPVVYPVNGMPVKLTNTTPPPGPATLTATW